MTDKLKQPSRFAIAIPSAVRENTDYLAETLKQFSSILSLDHDRIESINIYCSSTNATSKHLSYQTIRDKIKKGEYGTISKKITLRSELDLDDSKRQLHEKTRSDRFSRIQTDVLNTLSLSSNTEAKWLLFFEDDVRLTKHFIQRIDEIIQAIENKNEPPMLVSLFSVSYGPPGRCFNYYAYSQALLFRNGPDVAGAVEFLRENIGQKELPDAMFANYRENGRKPCVYYPSLVQHVGVDSLSVSDRDKDTIILAPTFKKNRLNAYDIAKHWCCWVFERARWRLRRKKH